MYHEKRFTNKCEKIQKKNIYLLWHYIHSLQIMKIKKYFFSTLVCIYLFMGGWVEYGHFFFSTLSIDSVSYARQIETEKCAIDMHFHETGLICFILNAISLTRF